MLRSIQHYRLIMEVESGETEITRDEATTEEAADGCEESKKIMAKRNTSVPVWKHFGFEANESGS